MGARKQVDNPWLGLNSRFVLPNDEEVLRRDTRRIKDKYKLQLHLPPVPFLGNPLTADVIILGKNPSYYPNDDDDHQRLPLLVEQNIAALGFDSDYPIFYLDPRFQDTEGYGWWNRMLQPTLLACQEQCGLTRRCALEKIACVQWYPYHSTMFADPLEPLPSQAFSFHMVARAAARGALFVLLWGAKNERIWRAAVPDLPSDCIRLNSSMSPHMSRRNMKDQDFERLLNRLCGST